ncbi:hypothetical protein Pint_27371 [Pistacia integerrima]|uniref:Uncharacterized protein n=1 Tax=Pistacia integerrima TaxID=434235 RepID=A0ACC0YUM7_9ROSI|nr:hypothetical protein Pint_27371 [Pistacia integerrima]
MLGNVLSLMKHHVCKWRSHNQFGMDLTFLRDRRFGKHPTCGRKYLTKSNEGSVSCSLNEGNNQDFKLSDARVIYSVAPAMGHNRESHPESHFRVPAIVTTLEEMELTSKLYATIYLDGFSFILAIDMSTPVCFGNY